jgi:hypothetical protein
MKRFLVFAYDHYYPSGGWKDFQDSFDDEKEAIGKATSLKETKTFDHAHVIDSKTGEAVFDLFSYKI